MLMIEHLFTNHLKILNDLLLYEMVGIYGYSTNKSENPLRNILNESHTLEKDSGQAVS